MERIKGLNRYQKGVLVVMVAMVLVFTVLYPVITSRQGFVYWDSFLVCTQEGDNTVYGGKVNGEPASFTVTPDKAVEFQYGQTTYGPYTLQMDPSAVPDGVDMAEDLTGIQLLCGDEVFFRGGVWGDEAYRILYDQDSGEEVGSGIFVGDGVTFMDENGNVIDPMEPSPYTILDLIEGPQLVHQGDWAGYFFGLVFCALTAVSVLYADELFRLQLVFQIRNVEEAEPAGWEIASRYITWTVMPVLALVLFVWGLF